MMKRLLIMLLPMLCVAAMAQVPELTRFYPDSREKIQQYKVGSKIYVYFETGSKIVSAKGQLIQNDDVLGTVVFKGATTPTTTATLNPADEDNECMEDLTPGDFSISVYEVTYLVDGEENTYSDVDNPLGSTTYNYAGQNGTIVSESGFSDNTMLSYYPADGEEGVITYVFSKAVSPDKLSANFEYGGGEYPYVTPLPWELSEDGLTLSIDLRGQAYDSNTLAYGNIFYDEQGNPTDPPATIIFSVTNLICTDGTKISTESSTLDGSQTYKLDGRIHKILYYDDITFDTPVLKQVEFFPFSNPSDTHSSIVDGCDMLALTVVNAAVLENADMLLAVDDIEATIAWADIKVEDETFTAAIPAEILAAGSENLVISLINYSFNQVDGVDHVIKPLNLSKQLKEVSSVAELKALEAGTTVALNVPGGVRVTLSNEAGYCFLEDENDGLMIVTEDYSKVLQDGVLLTGKLAGTYQGYGTFMIHPELSDYTEVETNVAYGTILGSLEDVLEGKYDFRLISLVANENMPIVSDGENIFIGNELVAITTFLGDFTMPETIEDITGILFADPSSDQPMLIVRTEDDINQELTLAIKNIASSQRNADAYTIGGTKANGTKQPGLYIIGGKKLLKR